MTALPSAQKKLARRRKRRLRTRMLVLVAVAASLALLFYRGTTQVLAQFSCTSNPLVINVVVSPDLAPAAQHLATSFNQEQQSADGRCVQVEASAEPPSVAASQVDGQHHAVGQSPVDAWIPDSSVWVDRAHLFTVGQQTVQPAGFSVAQSPLMLVMPPLAAARTAAFAKAGWHLLLPRAAGGPPVPLGFEVDLPDPAENAAGLAAVVQITRFLGTGQTARVNFTKFVYSPATSVTPYFDDPTSLASFVTLASPPVNAAPVTVTSEQAVIAYDQANPRQPLAARYPASGSSALGSPDLDYPYVLTTSVPARLAAANLFGQFLRKPYAQQMIRYFGFRSGTGVPDSVPSSFGLASQLLQPALPTLTASPAEAPNALNVWSRLSLNSRDLALIDVSAAMNNPLGQGGQSYLKLLGATASLGLGFFPNATNMGLWEFAEKLHGEAPYEQVVPVGPLDGSIGLISRRDDLKDINNGLRAMSGQGAALYGSILAAYTYMTRTYDPHFVNTLIVLTAGLENAPHDITAANLIKRLQKLYNPARRVGLVFVIFGRPPDFGQLQRIAAAIQGQAFEITDPNQVVRVFYEATARRLCNPVCVKA
jgi:hypothetical protein